MMISRIGSQARMSQAVVHGGIVYLAGQVARGPGTVATVADQMALVLEKIDRLLAEAGTTKLSLLSATIWLANMDAFAEMNAVWDGWVAEGCAPARATVEARLAAPELLVEISVIAAMP